MKDKKRLDLLLVEKGYFLARARAKAEIMAGRVFVNGKQLDKAGALIEPDAVVEIKTPTNPYVSRGGLKLEKALADLNIELSERIILDIGASTGGFTDCALQKGARKVYAVDVGYGQLAWTLRQDRRVVIMEKLNFRYLTPEHFPELPHLATVDVSFISLKLVFPVLKQLGVTSMITLIKPQFEAGPQNVGKGGVVRDPAIHQQVIAEIFRAAENEGFFCSRPCFFQNTWSKRKY